VRYHEAGRYILERDHVILTHPSAHFREAYPLPSGGSQVGSEFDVCKRIALEKGIPLRRVYDTVVRDAIERKITGKQGDVA